MMGIVDGDLLYPMLALTAFLAPLLVIYLVIARRRYRQHRTRERLLMMVAAMFVVVVLMAASVGMAVDRYVVHNGSSLVYKFDIYASYHTEGIVFVPAPVNEALRDQLTLMGNGGMSFVQTEHGEAMRIAFRGNVTVHGLIEKHGDLGNRGLTMLTSPWGGEAWMGRELQDNGTQLLVVRLSYDYHWGRSAFLYRVQTPLQEGWDTYTVEHKQT